jgi:hypothetical protein
VGHKITLKKVIPPPRKASKRKDPPKGAFTKVTPGRTPTSLIFTREPEPDIIKQQRIAAFFTSIQASGRPLPPTCFTDLEELTLPVKNMTYANAVKRNLTTEGSVCYDLQEAGLCDINVN